MFDVEFDISGELADVTVWAQVVGARDLDFTDSRQHELRAQFPVMSLMAAITRKNTLIGARFCEAQQLAQGGCTGVVHGRTRRHLDGFQIQSPCPAATVEDDLQQLVYLASDYPTDGFRRFFSCGEKRSGSDGRIWHICVLTAISSLYRS